VTRCPSLTENSSVQGKVVISRDEDGITGVLKGMGLYNWDGLIKGEIGCEDDLILFELMYMLLRTSEILSMKYSLLNRN
jgi:hypothetical protein